MERGKLKPEHEKCIREKYLILKKNIVCAQEITEYLYRKNIITVDDKEIILLKTTSCDKNEALLTIVLNGGPTLAFNEFCKALKKYSTKLWEDIRESFQCYMITTNCRSDCTNRCYCQIKGKNKSDFDVTLLRISLSANETDDDKTFRQGDDLEKIVMEHSGRVVNIVDYPPIVMENKKKLVTDAEQSLNNASTGFHAFLLVAKYGNNWNYSAYKILDAIKCIYGSDVLKYYGIILLAYSVQDEEHHINVEEWLETQDDKTKSYLEECGNRIVLVNAKEVNTIAQKLQVDNFIKAIDNLQFNGRRYTLSEFEKAEVGRKQLLLQEKEAQITEKTFLKCSQLLQNSKELERDEVEHLTLLIHQAIKLQQKVLQQDDGANILSEALSQIKVTIETLEESYKRLINIRDAKAECEEIQKQQEIQLNLKIDKFQKLTKQEQLLKEKLIPIENEARNLKQKIDRKELKQNKLKEGIQIAEERKRSANNKIDQNKESNLKLEKEINSKNKKTKVLLIINIVSSLILCFIVVCNTQYNKEDNDYNVHKLKRIYIRDYKSILKKWYDSKMDNEFLVFQLTNLQHEFQKVKNKVDANRILITELQKLLKFAKTACENSKMIMKKKIMDLEEENRLIAEKLLKLQQKTEEYETNTLELLTQINNELNTVKIKCNEQMDDLTKRQSDISNKTKQMNDNVEQLTEESNETRKELETMIHYNNVAMKACNDAVCTCCKNKGNLCQLLPVRC
ncbi:GTPase IMAP family member 4 [Biomphalaria pfeifferi]|uniref:GTPase IMAP family member 4 n=1 Tax=Biomphalaria pfeifferi TaxID=112525 RepID=A0AAD8C7K7_BIOPF|nr:GTPase IMAP family member 4 [Biomphalaria pfeifferi]